jgi:Ni2+-binding GTPase involved in maturation of urease and hydrogenase
MGMVKSVESGRTMVLTKVISDAKTKINGTPVKFDPKMMMQQHMQQQQQQNP